MNSTERTEESPFGDLPAATGPERKICANCNEEKPVTLGVWAYKLGGEALKICLVCQTLRKADSREARKRAAENTQKTPKELRGEAKIDVAKALKAGAAMANEYVDLILARVLQYAADPKHDMHAWAIQFLAERIMPRKLYENLGDQIAGVGLTDKRPQFVIQVLPASQPAGGRVIEGEVVPPIAILPIIKPTVE